ncbi:thioredoxin-like protein [Epithele typhae]|uniref:thioredoxin-like protein n=1 Tax=Epithele typhae TaxID=378194 RepID=UPI0020074717|nr:thioredoxin-like protein [Epithele typhae]KAH9938847.1 thioredoxin-like protein [Epithele typhae]
MSSTSENITLYSTVNSPFSQRVSVALDEAGVAYDLIDIDLSNKPEWYQQKVYTKGLVPYLVYGGPKLHPGETPSSDAIQIPESSVILEFLADSFPAAGLLPASPAGRARARLAVRAVDDAFKHVYPVLGGGPVEPLLAALEDIQALLPARDGSFLAGEGEGWGIADISVVPLLLSLRIVAGVLPGGLAAALQGERLARLWRYVDEGATRPSVAKNVDAEIIKSRFLAMVAKRKAAEDAKKD